MDKVEERLAQQLAEVQAMLDRLVKLAEETTAAAHAARDVLRKGGAHGG